MTAPTSIGTERELDDRFAVAKKVADAVLYEGYVLYPYRASAGKNQMRWQFGVLAPHAFAEVDGSEASSMQTEIIVEGRAESILHVRLRGLQVQDRTIHETAADGSSRPVASLDDGEQIWTSFDEAVEHQHDVAAVRLADLVEHGKVVSIRLPGDRQAQDIGGGRAIRERWPVDVRVALSAGWCDGPYPLARVTVAVENVTDWAGPAVSRDEVMQRSFVAVHTLLSIDGGRFVSLLDPPQFAMPAVASCTNVRTFPVIVSDDVVLSSPIILYDRPAVAPESAGDMFDATEIDEILALRVLTLTDDEKREARGTDPRSAAIVDRCDAMAPGAFEALHGTFRSIRAVGDPVDELPWWEPEVDASFDPWTDTVWVGPSEVGKGTRVRLRPSRRSDAQDLFLAGRQATVAGVFHDVDDDVYLAVVVDDDATAEWHEFHGRYLYFHPDEVEIEEGLG